MLKIGVLGAARIVPWALMEPAARRDDVQVVSIAARRAGAAKAFAERYGIAGVHVHYDEVLADPSVDLIYNALPPYLHAELSIKALEAGKDVLCEKPFAMNAVEARRMNEAAARAGRRIIEAFHDRHHPVFLHLLDRAKSGQIGKIKMLHGVFNHTIPRDPTEFRRIPAMGGGALMDLGCYPVHWCRSLLGEEPEVVEATAAIDPAGYDEEMRATLAFPSGVNARIECVMSPGWQYHARFTIEGERGTLVAENSLLPQLGHSIRETIDGVLHRYAIGGGTTFDHQLAAVVGALKDGTPLPTEGADPIGNMTTIDAIYARAGVCR